MLTLFSRKLVEIHQKYISAKVDGVVLISNNNLEYFLPFAFPPPQELIILLPHCEENPATNIFRIKNDGSGYFEWILTNKQNGIYHTFAFSTG